MDQIQLRSRVLREDQVRRALCLVSGFKERQVVGERGQGEVVWEAQEAATLLTT